MTRSQSSTVILRTVLSRVMPALLTRMSRRPWVSRTSWMTRSQSSAEPNVALVGAGAGVGFAEGVGDVFAAGVARGDGDSACGEAFADRQSDSPHTSCHEGYLSGHVRHEHSFRRVDQVEESGHPSGAAVGGTGEESSPDHRYSTSGRPAPPYRDRRSASPDSVRYSR